MGRKQFPLTPTLSPVERENATGDTWKTGISALLLYRFLEFGDEGLRPALHITQFANFFSVRVQNDEGRIAFDLIFLLELLVGLLQFGGLLFLAGEIDFYQHQVLLRLFCYFRFGE